MEEVSYTARNLKDQDQIGEFLSGSRVGVVGIAGDKYPYAVPVNYVWHDGAVYFHGMGSGKKLSLLKDNPDVSFTVFRENGTISDPVPCKADTSYKSVMIFGRAEKVEDVGEATGVLQAILDKFTPGFYKRAISETMVEKYRSAMDGNAVAVVKITPVHITAKANDAVPDFPAGHGHPGHPGAGHPGHPGGPGHPGHPGAAGHPGHMGGAGPHGGIGHPGPPDANGQ
ncbi:pyridoxamine 5'-phosphate oxidase family protein [Paenibacillus sp. HN-1]|uniref:pyridoxamine 5'-phosphate oxidase family protein n=1 Tax=Paenibacillus TaxID=44249 RepID=UPI001CA7E096|nr:MULTISPECIES: pyridoxamine 5'-phosphate oxidase family protein [Paenibacillus]MBY9079746.1 pyridoxamine 5'-phosphate oxidase family protein [Paenibacillus sp. CGMCC 1.18879]MBY9084390.1 pyridoxamine 5'-phosphate oxidase family protein [Paenibacillus sinensis]